MKTIYYPGCTLKYKAKNLESSALASLSALDIEVIEMERWNCCGAVYSLANDDLIHMVGPVRNLIRARQQGASRVVTLCSMCYNTLFRANLLMAEDAKKRETINAFMDEEEDYFGDVEVIHYLSLLKENAGFTRIKERVTRPLTTLRVASYYGCTLQRPAEAAIEPMGSFTLMNELITALGALPVPFNSADRCCGSYQVMCEPEGENTAAATVLHDAADSGADLIVTSCPLCEFNLGLQQQELLACGKITKTVPTLYFTQLLALALGIDENECRFDLNSLETTQLLAATNIRTAV